VWVRVTTALRMITMADRSSIPAFSAAGRALTSFDVHHSKAREGIKTTCVSRPGALIFMALFVQTVSRAHTYMQWTNFHF
jgi:hypothetical protein